MKITALKSTIGENTYYSCSMTVGQVLNMVSKPPSEFFENDNLESVFQREINETRVENNIVPYFMNEKNIFINSIVVALYNEKTKHQIREGEFNQAFEHIKKLLEKDTEAISNYIKEDLSLFKNTVSINLGAEDSEDQFIILDGQHRVFALKKALEKLDGKPTRKEELLNYKISVLIVEYELKKCRRIFNDINQYAKPTSGGSNILTDDKKDVNIVTRYIATELFKGNFDFLELQGSSLGKNKGKITTLRTIDNINVTILGFKERTTENIIKKLNKTEHEKLQEYKKHCLKQWKKLISNITILKDCFECLHSIVEYDEKKERIKKISFDNGLENLLLKPKVLEMIFGAYLRLSSKESDCYGLKDKEIFDKINQINFNSNNKDYQGIFLEGDRIKTSKENLLLGIEFFIYLVAGENYKDKDKLKERILKQSSFDEKTYQLPDPL